MIDNKSKLENVTLKEFTLAVNNLARRKDSLVFSNKGPDHAAVVISTILDYSGNSVRIFAKSMDGTISSFQRYQESLKKFLSEGKVIKVLLEDFPYKEGEDLPIALEILRNNASYSNVTVKLANNSFKASLRKKQLDKNTLYHFCVGDDHMIRLETDNKNHIAPLCSFNDEKNTRTLTQIFDKNFEDCEDIVFKV